MRTSGKPARVYPQRVSPGDTVGIIAPGSPISSDLLRAGCKTLERLGYKPFYFASILDQDHYFAGAHQQRAHELEQMFLKPEIRAIVCARGGYGCNHLLPHINLETVRKNPKMFIGYSDVTTLLTYFCDQTDVIMYHGPMVTKDYAEASDVTGGEWLRLNNFDGGFEIRGGERQRQPVEGEARGVLYGGCLTLLAASLGTPYEIKTENTILFLEDINAKPYQIDRMLMQMKYSGKFEEVRGVVFGEMVGCVQPGGQDYSLQDIVGRVLEDLKIPVGFGLPSGHVTSPPNYCLPIGAEVSLSVSADGFVLRSEGE
jgi:muramoyltetrapeptide carboxypeptidase